MGSDSIDTFLSRICSAALKAAQGTGVDFFFSHTDPALKQFDSGTFGFYVFSSIAKQLRS